MPHHILAAVLIQLDQPHPSKQELLCFEYAVTSRLEVIAVTNEVSAALSMVMVHTVAAVIAAVDPGGTFADELARWGGQLHVVRPRRSDGIEDRVLRSGLDTQQIARLLKVSPEEARRRRRNRRE